MAWRWLTPGAKLIHAPSSSEKSDAEKAFRYISLSYIRCILPIGGIDYRGLYLSIFKIYLYLFFSIYPVNLVSPAIFRHPKKNCALAADAALTLRHWLNIKAFPKLLHNSSYVHCLSNNYKR